MDSMVPIASRSVYPARVLGILLAIVAGCAGFFDTGQPGLTPSIRRSCSR